MSQWSTLRLVTKHEDVDCINMAHMNLGSKLAMFNLLSEKLSKNQLATKLYLHSNYITDESMPKIVELLKIYTNIQIVYLYDNKIGDEGAKLIASLLSTTDNLRILELSYNSIGDYGVKLLSDSLLTNKSLDAIYMSNNNIGSDGIKYIFDTLKTNVNTTLKTIGISFNVNKQITYNLVESLCSFCRENKTVNRIFMYGIKIGADDMNRINDAIEFNRSIIHLNFNKRNKVIEGICERNNHNLFQQSMKLVDF